MPTPPKLPETVPVEVVVRPQALPHAPATPVPRYWLHPTSGWLVLGVDWLFFAPEAMTAEVAAILLSPVAFLITAAGVFWIQRRRNGDGVGKALFKALLCGVVAGIPTSISGTVLGAAILFLSGRGSWNQRRG